MSCPGTIRETASYSKWKQIFEVFFLSHNTSYGFFFLPCMSFAHLVWFPVVCLIGICVWDCVWLCIWMSFLWFFFGSLFSVRFVLFWWVCFCFTLFFACLIFLMRGRQNECGLGWVGKWCRSERSLGGKLNQVFAYCIKKSIFNKKNF